MFHGDSIPGRWRIRIRGLNGLRFGLDGIQGDACLVLTADEVWGSEPGSTERIVLPLIGDGVNAADLVAFNGNFGVCNASPAESWITDGSWCPKTNTGELNLARVKWRKPNGLLEA